MANLRSIINRVSGARGARTTGGRAGGVRQTGGVGGTAGGVGGASGTRRQDEAIGRGVRGLLSRLRR